MHFCTVSNEPLFRSIEVTNPSFWLVETLSTFSERFKVFGVLLTDTKI